MAVIALDATGGVNRQTTNGVSFTHICSGSNRILIVITYNNNNVGSISGVTYNGVSMTRLGGATNASNEEVALWYLVAPATGSNSVTISCSASSTVGASSASYTGASQSGFPDNDTTNSNSSSTSISTSLTTMANNCWTILGAVVGGGSIVASTGSTLRNKDGSGAHSFGIFDNNAAVTPAGNSTMAVTAASGNNVTIMASLAPFITSSTRTQSDSISVGASRTVTNAKIYSAIRTASDAISVGASRIVSIGKGVTRFISDSLSNAASRFVTFIVKATLWPRRPKSSSTFTNDNKDTSIWTDNNKDTSTFSNQQKS